MVSAAPLHGSDPNLACCIFLVFGVVLCSSSLVIGDLDDLKGLIVRDMAFEILSDLCPSSLR